MAGPILPSESNAFSVGSSNNRFLDAYFSRAVDISGVAISPDANGNGIMVTSAATGALADVQADYVLASNIRSIGDVQADYVIGSNIRSVGDVQAENLIADYVLGSNIRSVGDVQAAFVLGSNIRSVGDVQANYILGSNIRSVGDVQAAFVLGSNIRSVGDVQAQNITASGLLTASNIRVLGDYVILDTITSNTEQMVITNDGTGPALKVTQTGANSIAEFYDDGNALAFKVANDGLVGIGTTTPLQKLHVVGSALVSANLVVAGGDIKTGATIASTLFSDTTTGTVTLGATGSTGAVSMFPANGAQAITLGGATTGLITLGSTSASAVQLPTGKTKVGQTTLAQGGAVSVTLPAATGTLLTVENALTAGSATAGFLKYNGTTAAAGQLDGGTTTPTGTTRLNYGGYLYPTAVNLVGTGDTATSASHYLVETGSDGFVRPKTLADAKAELVTTASVNLAAATTLGTITSGVWNAGAVTSSSTVSAGTQVLAPAGNAVGTPGFSWTGDLDTGMYRPGENMVGLVTGGVEKVRILANGNVGIGAMNPPSLFCVENNIADDTSAVIRLANKYGSGSVNPVGTGMRIVFNGYRDSNPNHEIAAISAMKVNGDRADYLVNAGEMHFSTNPGISPYSERGNVQMVINRFGNVGIGTTNPQEKLHVEGNIKANGVHRVVEIDLLAQTNTTFYPILLDNAPAMYTHYFSIEMPSQSGVVSYNMHSLHAVVRSGGWSDQNSKYEVFHNTHADNERSILGIYGGTQSFWGTIVYLRGGQKYTFVTNSQTVAKYISAVTLGDAPYTSTFALKNVSGADISGTSVNITQHWSGMGPAGKTLSHGLIVNGNVGIGTTDPVSKFHVLGKLDIHQVGAGGGENRFNGLEAPSNANGRAQLVLSSAYSDVVIASSQANSSYGSTLTFAAYDPGNSADYRKFVIQQRGWGGAQFMDFGYTNTATTNPHTVVGNGRLLTLDGNNQRVGIGIANPSAPLHVALSSGNQTINGHGYLNSGGAGASGGGPYGITGISAIMSGACHAELFRAFSDKRIKNNVTSIDNALDIIRQIEPVQYDFVDRVQHSNSSCGFIAQDVETQLGILAVNKTDDFIPNVYDVAKVNDNKITCLNKKLNIDMSDKEDIIIRLYDKDNKTTDVIVKELIDDQTFTTSHELLNGDYFVFGQKVKDFRVLDYNVVFTYAVKALKELDEAFKTEKEDHELTKMKITKLEARLQAAGF